MDPNANLQEQLELAQEIQTLEDELGEAEERPRTAERIGLCEVLNSEMAKKGARLAELALALNNWLARGGFPPTWKEV